MSRRMTAALWNQLSPSNWRAETRRLFRLTLPLSLPVWLALAMFVMLMARLRNAAELLATLVFPGTRPGREVMILIVPPIGSTEFAVRRFDV